jgi:hypothetical protein
MPQVNEQVSDSNLRSQVKTPLHTLIRVRNNQRRHRERRREYIATLEAKIHETQNALEQAVAEIARLKAEVERSVTASSTTSTPFRTSSSVSLKLDDHDGQRQQDLAEVQLSPSEGQAPSGAVDSGEGNVLEVALQPEPLIENPWAVAVAAQSTVPAGFATMSFRVGDASAFQTVASCQLPLNATVSPAPVRGEAVPKIRPRCCSLDETLPTTTLASNAPAHDPTTLQIQELTLYPPPSDYESYPPLNPPESTTLCSQAYILIAQQNFRGLSSQSIVSWLNEGFRRATARGEGCRVENGLLFGLLDFVSGA